MRETPESTKDTVYALDTEVNKGHSLCVRHRSQQRTQSMRDY